MKTKVSLLCLAAIVYAAGATAALNSDETSFATGGEPAVPVIEEVEFFKFTGHEDGQAIPGYVNIMVVRAEGAGITSIPG